MMNKYTVVILFSAIGLLLTNCNPKTGKVIEEDQSEAEVKLLEPFEPYDPNAQVHGILYAQIDMDTSVRTGRLSNGLRYYIKKNRKPENRAELRLVVKAGSINEDANQLGLAHFIEHMAFNGTKNFSKNELVDYLESVGSRFGPDLNAYTSFDETVYMLQVRTDEDEQLNKGILVLSDWASGLTFDHDEIDKERGVVISEWRSRLSPNQRMQNEYLPVLLKGSRYAQRLPIGDPEIIENASYSTIKEFYYHWYRPDLMAIVAVGDFNVNLMEELIVSQFEDTPKAIRPRERKQYDVPDHDETLVSICSDKEAAFTQVRLVQKMDEFKIKLTSDFQQYVMHNLFVRMLNSRLNELTKSANPPFMYASSNKSRDIANMDSYTCFAVSEEGNVMQALANIIRENERIIKHGFTESELERARKEMLSDAEKEMNEENKTESRLFASRCINHFLHDQPVISPAHNYQMIEKYSKGITAAQISPLIFAWYQPKNRVVIITAPEKDGVNLPTKDEVLSLFDEVKKEDIQPYVDNTSDAPLLDKTIGTTKPIKSEISKQGIETLMLPNGARVHIKSTDFNNDQVILGAIAKGGHSVFSDEDYLEAQTSTAIVDQSGLGEFSQVELGKKLSGKNVNVRTFVSNYFQELSAECAVNDLETMLQLVYLYFTNPRKDKESFESFKNKQKSIYSNLLSDPGYYYYNEVNRITNSDHPRSTFPTEEDIDNLDFNKSFEAFRKLYSNAANFEFYVVGNIDQEGKKIIQNYLGALPSSDDSMEPRNLEAKFPDSNVYQWKKGEAPKSYVSIKFSDGVGDKDGFEYQLKGLNEIMKIRLREVLREDKGGVYGVRVSESVSTFPNNEYVVSVSFTCDPENTKALIDEANKVFEELSATGPKPEDLLKIKEIRRQKLTRSFKENKFWLSAMLSNHRKGKSFENLDMDYQERQLADWTSENLKSTADQVFNKAKKVVLIQDPE